MPDVTATPWLWPPMEKQDAEQTMTKDGPLSNGKFFIRERKKGNDKLYALALVHKGKVTHHRIDKSDGGKFTVNQKPAFGQYASLQALVTTLSGGEGCPAKWPTKLAEPVLNPNPITLPTATTPTAPTEDLSHLKWLHGNIDRDQVVELFKGGSDGTFLVRSGPTGASDEFVLSVVFKGKPTHHKISKGGDGVFTINKKSYGIGARKLVDLITTLQTETIEKWPVKLSNAIEVTASPPSAEPVVQVDPPADKAADNAPPAKAENPTKEEPPAADNAEPEPDADAAAAEAERKKREEAEEAERRQQEADRKQKEAEEAERRQQEADRKQKEAEEAERAKAEADAAARKKEEAGEAAAKKKEADEAAKATKAVPPPKPATSADTAADAANALAGKDFAQKLTKLFAAADISGSLAAGSVLDKTELRYRLNTKELTKLLTDANVIDKVDVDGDGKVTAAELLSKLDKDGDGKLSMDEFFTGLDTEWQRVKAEKEMAAQAARARAMKKKLGTRTQSETISAADDIASSLANLVADEEAKDNSEGAAGTLERQTKTLATGISDSEVELKMLQEQQAAVQQQMEARRLMATQLQAQQAEYQRQMQLFQQMQLEAQLQNKAAKKAKNKTPRRRPAPGSLVSSAPGTPTAGLTSKPTARRRDPMRTRVDSNASRSAKKKPSKPKTNTLVSPGARVGTPGYAAYAGTPQARASMQQGEAATTTTPKRRRTKRAKGGRAERREKAGALDDEQSARRQSTFQRIRDRIQQQVRKEQVSLVAANADANANANPSDEAVAAMHTKVVVLQEPGMFVSDAGFLVKDGRYAHETDI